MFQENISPQILKNTKIEIKGKGKERIGYGKSHIYCLHYIYYKSVVDCWYFSTMNKQLLEINIHNMFTLHDLYEGNFLLESGHICL